MVIFFSSFVYFFTFDILKLMVDGSSPKWVLFICLNFNPPPPSHTHETKRWQFLPSHRTPLIRSSHLQARSILTTSLNPYHQYHPFIPSPIANFDVCQLEHVNVTGSRNRTRRRRHRSVDYVIIHHKHRTCVYVFIKPWSKKSAKPVR